MARLAYIRDPEAIYEQSFSEIESLPELQGLDGAMRPIAIRMVHACGMPDIVADLRWSDGFQQVGRDALARGAAIFCDVESLGSTIMKRLLPEETTIRCDINSSQCQALAREEKCTRAAAQVDLWGDAIDGSIVVIGNAPTTLFRILENMDNGGARPALILGFPVGFVGAAESKAELADNPRGVPYITLMGRRGGTAIAAACMNAIAAGLAR